MAEEIKFRKIKIFSYILLAVVFIAGIFLYLNMDAGQGSAESGSIIALIDKYDYSHADKLRVEIENKEGKSICFSSCYPYVLQMKNIGWNDYSYSGCEEQNVAEICIDPGQLKAFEIPLNEISLKPAVHRLAIPACIGCAIGEQFRVDKIIYSSEFEIKK